MNEMLKEFIEGAKRVNDLDLSIKSELNDGRWIVSFVDESGELVCNGQIGLWAEDADLTVALTKLGEICQ